MRMPLTMTLVTWTTAVVLFTVPRPATAAADRGAELFVFCAQCHGSQGQGNRVFLAPSIAGLDRWYIESTLHKFQSGIRGTHPEDASGLRMYPMSLHLKSDEDVAAVAAHVAGLEPVWPEPELEGGDAARGATLFATCTACHGPDAAGMETLRAPPIQRLNDWYLFTSLQKFKAGVRGGSPADTTGAQMRPMAMTLPDERAMRDVIAHIMSLRGN